MIEYGGRNEEGYRRMQQYCWENEDACSSTDENAKGSRKRQYILLGGIITIEVSTVIINNTLTVKSIILLS